MAEPPVTFAGLLRQLRAEARLTQEELAEAARLRPRSISDLERGITRTARFDTAQLLAAALGLDGPVCDVFVAAARGRGPAEDVLAAREGRTPDAGRGAVCPYRGLLPFSESDAKVFYGREQLAEKLAGRVSRGGLVVVTGASGSGKSSLLRAGLVPILARGRQVPGSDRWPRIVMTPTKDPLTELATHLAAVGGPDALAVRDGLAQHRCAGSVLGVVGQRGMLGTASARKSAPSAPRWTSWPSGTLSGAPRWTRQASMHGQQLRDALAAYLKAGRRISGGTRRPVRSGRRGSANDLNTTEVREWARTQGIEVKNRGRVPADLVVKFKAATGQ